MQTSTIASLSAAAATGAGSAVDVPQHLSASNNAGVYISTTGSPSAISVTVQISPSPSGSEWLTVGSAITATGVSTVTLPPGSFRVRLNLGTLTGGTAPTVTGAVAFRYDT